MKQKLSLIVAVFIAVCAYAAQNVFRAAADGEPEKIVFENGATYTDFQEFTTENVKLVLGKDGNKWKKNEAKSFKGDYMAPFSQKVLIENTETSEMEEKDRLIYLVGSNNPKDLAGGGFNGTLGMEGKLPQTGTYYMITPSMNGTVLLGMVLNADKEFFIVDATDAVETPVLDADGNPTEVTTLNVVNDNAVFQHDAFKVCQEDGTELAYADAAPADGSNALIDGGKGGVKVVTKITGTAEFDAQANHTYYVFCTGSKLTIVGLLFTPSVAAEPEDIEISPASGDISAALEEASAGKLVRNITINLTEGANYTMSAPVVAPASLVINGNGATIDASAVDAALFQLSTTPAVEAVNDYFRVENMKIANVTITGVKHNIIYDNNTKYCVVDLTIENAVIGLATESVSNDALIAFQAGGVKDVNIKNSTVYGNAVAKYFIRYNNSARLDRYGFDKETEFMTMNYQSNTFYKVIAADGQWANYSAVGGQNYVKFDIQKNIWVDCAGDVIRRLAGGRFGSNAPKTFAYNTYFKDGEDLSASEANYDNSGNILTTDPKFADAANADFHIFAGSDQAKYQTGDPRWLVEYDESLAPPTDITISPAEGDIYAALAAAEEGVKKVGNITINLTEGAAYTVSAPIVAPACLTINGNNATIDASAVDAALFQLSTTPAVEAVNDYFRVENMKIANVTITGVKHNIIYDNNTKYCVVDLTIENAVIGLATESVSNDALIAFQAGGVKDVNIKNSTVYGNAVAKYFIRYNNSARLDRYGFDKETEFMTMNYQSNTFYKVIAADGQWANYSAVGGQNYVKFDIQKNIWVDCAGDVIRRLAGGRFGGSAPKTFAYNTYFKDGEDLSASEASYDNSETILTTNPGFKDADNADFALAAQSDQAKNQTGDPRWGTYEAFTINVVAENCEVIVTPYAAEGTKVYVDVKPAEGYEVSGGTVVNDTTGEEIQVMVEGDGDNEKHYFIMPASNVTVTMTVVKLAKLTLSETTNGQVTVVSVNMQDDPYAESGKKICMMVKPDEGYEVQSVVVKDAADADVEVIQESGVDHGQDYNYYFLMPESDVTITVTFAVIDSIEGINAAETNDGKWYNLQGVQVKAPTKGIFIHNGKKVILK